uniref:Cerebellar degeneration-related protein 2-like n=2 Tax=Ceratitis capitata TaxID=7213 RepID=W8BTD4_CERCA
MEVFTEGVPKAGEEDASQYMLDDLQLAAELGKTLLERNKELETLVKELKGTIDEQQQEIVYLKKHANALREVNDTRLKVYEQLDLGIQDMERSNHRLTAENNSDKKHIKTLVQTIEALEARQEELNKQIDELRQSLTMERRKNERLSSANERRNTAANESSRSSNGVLNSVAVKESSSTNKGNDSGSERGYEPSTTAPENCSFEFGTSAQPESKANSTSIGVNQSNENSMGLSDLVCNADDSEEIIKLVNDLEMMKKAFLAEQQRCTELEEQLVAIIQENQMLQSRLASNSPNEEMRSMQEELSVLDEVREGKMCSRCMRVLDDPDTIGDEQLSLAPTDDYQDEERSLLDNASECSQAIYRPGVSIKADKMTLCPICSSNASTKYLQEQLPVSLDTMFLKHWQKTMRKFNVLCWITKFLQWPALFICRLISSVPDDEDFALTF